MRRDFLSDTLILKYNFSPTGSNLRVATSYDAANRPITLTGNPTGQSTNYVTGVQYFANGGINTLTRGNGLTYSEAYNPRLQPTGITEQSSSGIIRDNSGRDNSGVRPKSETP